MLWIILTGVIHFFQGSENTFSLTTCEFYVGLIYLHPILKLLDSEQCKNNCVFFKNLFFKIFLCDVLFWSSRMLVFNLLQPFMLRVVSGKILDLVVVFERSFLKLFKNDSKNLLEKNQQRTTKKRSNLQYNDWKKNLIQFKNIIWLRFKIVTRYLYYNFLGIIQIHNIGCYFLR